MPAAPAARLIRPESCGKCKWSHPQPTGKGLECRERLTVAILPGSNGQPVAVSGFGPVPPDLWCGQWKPRVEIAMAGTPN